MDAWREETEALLGKGSCGKACWQLPWWSVRKDDPADSPDRKEKTARSFHRDLSNELDGIAFSPRLPREFSLKSMQSSVRVETNGLLSTVEGWHGSARKILRYDLTELVKSGGLFTLFHAGTMVHDPNVQVFILAMAAIMCVSCSLTFVAAAGDLPSLVEIDMVPLHHLMSQINSITAFISAQYVVICLARWWAIRTRALQEVYDSFMNLCILLNCALQGPRWGQVRQQVQKYGFAAMHLLVMAARREEDLDQLVADGLLTRCEAAFLLRQPQAWQRPMAVWTWIMRISCESLDVEISASAYFAKVTAACLGGLQGITTITKYLDTQLPFAYVHLVLLLVNISNIMLALSSGIGIAKAFAKGNLTSGALQAVGCLGVCFLYSSLLQISCLVLDPFGDSIQAFPYKAYHGYMASTVQATSEAQTACPLVAADGTLRHEQMEEALHDSSDEYEYEYSKGSVSSRSSRSFSLSSEASPHSFY